MPRSGLSTPAGRGSGNGLDVAGVAFAAMALRQKRTYETVLATNRALADSLQAIAAEQYEMLRECVDDAADAMKDAVGADNALVVARRQAEFAKKTIAAATLHASQCADIATRSTRSVASMWSDRLTAGLEDWQRAARASHNGGDAD